LLKNLALKSFRRHLEIKFLLQFLDSQKSCPDMTHKELLFCKMSGQPANTTSREPLFCIVSRQVNGRDFPRVTVLKDVRTPPQTQLPEKYFSSTCRDTRATCPNTLHIKFFFLISVWTRVGLSVCPRLEFCSVLF
jgi:hypothetical protein